jgi:hypothetical protein
VLSYRVILDVPLPLVLFVSKLLAGHRRERLTHAHAPRRRLRLRLGRSGRMAGWPLSGALPRRVQRTPGPRHTLTCTATRNLTWPTQPRSRR